MKKAVQELKISKQTNKTAVKSSKSKLDTLVYWIVQIIFAVLSGAGLWYYLQPVDPILAIPFTASFVALLFYVSLRNR